ncbi:MAG: serine dehydratase beta chain, partial [Oceanospirillum sp.]|nr:serine dehydratase beta chain [Oceanospirillum sp.]
MSLSIFDLFKIGIGPSSSHTVGPMIAANRFIDQLKSQTKENNSLDQISRVKTELFGSLALTGKGHATDTAVLLGLLGEQPDTVETTGVDQMISTIRHNHQLLLGGEHNIEFNEAQDLVFHFQDSLPEHPNGMRFSAFDQAGMVCCQGVYYSVGGGFVLSEDEIRAKPELSAASQLPKEMQQDSAEPRPYPFKSGKELLARGNASGKTIAQMMLDNEIALQAPATADESQCEAAIRQQLMNIWQVMDDCVRKGCKETGELPGGLNIKRRAPELYKELTEKPENALKDQLQENKKNLSLESITSYVAKDLNIKPSEIRSKSRSKNLVYARRIAIYICRELTQNTMPQLAQYFGMKDHTAISHTLKKINSLIETDEDFKTKIKELTNKI